MVEPLFPGRSELADRMRRLDWSRTSVGPVEDWPPTLRVAIDLCLTSPVPMQVWWGPDLTLFYNDASIAFLGPRKHPEVLGKPARSAWPEIWDRLGPIVDRVRSTGDASWAEDIPIRIDRHVPREEVCVTFSFSPILGRDGRIGGLLGVCTETTDTVAGARRLETLRRLGLEPAAARTTGRACREAAAVLADNPHDLPFAAIYLLDDAQTGIELRATAGLRDGLLPARASRDDETSPWPLATVLRTRRPAEIDLGTLGGAVSDDLRPEDVSRALVLPVPSARPGGVSGVFVAGLNAHQRLDGPYRLFCGFVAAHIGSALADAAAFEAERERAQLLAGALRQSAQRYHALFNSISEAFTLNEAIVDAHGRIVDFRFLEVNPAFEAQSGLSGVVGRTMREVLPDIEPEWIATFAQVVRTGESIRCERRAATLDRWFEVMASSVPSEPGHIAILFNDVTERKRAEAALRESEARLAGQKEAFQLAVSGAPLEASLAVLARTVAEQTGPAARTAFFVVDADGTCLRPIMGAGNMAESYLRAVDGFLIGPLLPACGSAVYYGVPVISADVNDDPLWEPWLAVTRDHDIRACWSFPMKTLGDRVLGTFAMYYTGPRDATPRDIELGTSVAQAAAIIVSRDREARERQMAEEALRDVDRRKNEFLATLAHELRNPLAPIGNAVQTLRLAGDRADAAARARAIIERQLAQLIRLVDDLLDISRISRDRIDLRKQRVTLSSIVDSAVETSRPLIEAAGHALSVTMPPDVVWLDADVTRMAQVLANLLNNAAKYTPDRGTIALIAERQAGEVVVRVRDNGIGISPDLLPRVFDMFTQLATDERSRTGLGLGLTIVRRLVEMHGGRVGVTSEGSGRGSELTVRLPVAADQPPLPASGAEDRASMSRLAGQRVLVVDDNRDAAQSLGDLLQMAGSVVRVVHDARAALDEAERFQPTLALLDIGMPGMNGYELARRLRGMPALQRLILVAVTGWGQDDDRRRSREAGFNYHLTKPTDLASLDRLLGSATATAR